MILTDTQKEILKAIVEYPSTDISNAIDDVQFLMEKGLLVSPNEASDKGVAYAVASANASFSQYLKANPSSLYKWQATMNNLKDHLSDTEIDFWFYCICLSFLELNYFTEWNSFES